MPMRPASRLRTYQSAFYTHYMCNWWHLTWHDLTSQVTNNCETARTEILRPKNGIHRRRESGHVYKVPTCTVVNFLSIHPCRGSDYTSPNRLRVARTLCTKPRKPSMQSRTTSPVVYCTCTMYPWKQARKSLAKLHCYSCTTKTADRAIDLRLR